MDGSRQQQQWLYSSHCNFVFYRFPIRSPPPSSPSHLHTSTHPVHDPGSSIIPGWLGTQKFNSKIFPGKEMISCFKLFSSLFICVPRDWLRPKEPTIQVQFSRAWNEFTRPGKQPSPLSCCAQGGFLKTYFLPVVVVTIRVFLFQMGDLLQCLPIPDASWSLCEYYSASWSSSSSAGSLELRVRNPGHSSLTLLTGPKNRNHEFFQAGDHMLPWRFHLPGFGGFHYHTRLLLLPNDMIIKRLPRLDFGFAASLGRVVSVWLWLAGQLLGNVAGRMVMN